MLRHRLADIDHAAIERFNRFRLCVQHEIGLASKRALANFEILPEDLKLCLIFLQQQNRRKFTDRYHAKLRKLVELGLLEVSGERKAATVFEIPLGVWFAMNDEVWGQGYPKIEREPWLPSNF